jgi:2-polyprenyl-6-methoxyphenol hydroxylase-like FAD-dependent oxidoreductase
MVVIHFCRQAIGVGVDEHDYDQVAIVTTVQTSKPHQQVGFERFSALGPLAFYLYQVNTVVQWYGL